MTSFSTERRTERSTYFRKVASPLEIQKPDGTGALVSWSEWRGRLGDSFRRCFWVPEKTGESGVEVEETLVNKRPLVKDSYGASAPFADYQLRPNFAVALAAAPDLLPAAEAWAALQTAQRWLNGPHIGIKTLDPTDWAYHGHYHSGGDSDHFATSQGLNYHQGPEWVWVKAAFLRARLAVARQLSPDAEAAVVAELEGELALVEEELGASVWASLPELTNAEGAECHDSCGAQAWSIAQFLQLLADLTAKTRSESE